MMDLEAVVDEVDFDDTFPFIRSGTSMELIRPDYNNAVVSSWLVNCGASLWWRVVILVHLD